MNENQMAPVLRELGMMVQTCETARFVAVHCQSDAPNSAGQLAMKLQDLLSIILEARLIAKAVAFDLEKKADDKDARP